MKFAGLEYMELQDAMKNWDTYAPVEISHNADLKVREAINAVMKPFYDQKRREVYLAAVAFVKACEAED